MRPPPSPAASMSLHLQHINVSSIFVHTTRCEREANAIECVWRGIATKWSVLNVEADIAKDANEVRRECKQVAEHLIAIFAAKQSRCTQAAVDCVGAQSIRILAAEISKDPLTRLRASKLFVIVASAESIRVMELQSAWKTRRAEWEGISAEWQKNRLRVDAVMARARVSHEEAMTICLDKLAPPYANLAAMAALWRKLPAGTTRKCVCAETKQQALVAAHAADNLRSLLDIASEGGSVYEDPL